MVLKNLQENIILANHTTFRLGGPARYFFEAATKEDLKEVIRWAKENNLRYFILGGGSNLLVSDKGFDGLIIKNKLSATNFEEQDEILKVKAETGVFLSTLVIQTTKKGFSGLEWAFGIPGTLGGAIYGNAHRVGRDMTMVVEKVEILDENLNEKKISRQECEFDYGQSRFKKTGEVILSADLIFRKQPLEVIENVLNQAKEVTRGHPPFPSAGCIFANYKLKNQNDDLLLRYPELASRVREGKIGVGYLIDQCGLKGRQQGNAKIWEGHANYIVNFNNATTQDVLALIDICKKAVKEKFGVNLEEETRYLE